MLVILAFQLELQAALGVHFLNGNFHAGLNGRTVDGGAAGQRAAHTNLDCIGTLRSLLRAASGEHCGYHQSSHQHSKYFFHDSVLLFHFLL